MAPGLVDMWLRRCLLNRSSTGGKTSVPFRTSSGLALRRPLRPLQLHHRWTPSLHQRHLHLQGQNISDFFIAIVAPAR